MQWKVSMIVLTGLSVLFVTGCGTVRRTVTHEATDLRIQESTEVTARDSVVVELRDTLVETTTITIDRNEVGDTLRVTQVTDRDRARDRSQLRDKSEKIIVRVDTVYVAVRDSTDVWSYGATESQSGGTTLHRTLKWILAIAFLLLTSVVLVRARH